MSNNSSSKTPQKEQTRRVQEFEDWLNSHSTLNEYVGNQSMISGPCYKIGEEDWKNHGKDFMLPWGMTLHDQGWSNLTGKTIRLGKDKTATVQAVWFDYENYYYEVFIDGKKKKISAGGRHFEIVK